MSAETTISRKRIAEIEHAPATAQAGEVRALCALARRALDAAPLVQFACAVMHESRSELGDLDGGWLQDTADACGVLAMQEVTEPCHPEACRCAEYGFPTQCYRYTPEVAAIVRSTAPRPSEPGGQP